MTNNTMKTPQEIALSVMQETVRNSTGLGVPFDDIICALTAANILHHPGPTEEEFGHALAMSSDLERLEMNFGDGADWAYGLIARWKGGADDQNTPG